MKKIIIFIGVVVVVTLGLSGIKDTFAKAAVSGICRSMTGLDLRIQKLSLSLIKTSINIQNLKLYNPKGFEDRVMLDSPQIFVNYGMGSMFKETVHLNEMTLSLKEITIIKNTDGALNLDSLKPKKSDTKTSNVNSKKIDFSIGKLNLKIDKVIYKDYSSGKVLVKEYNVNINEQYADLKSINALVPLIVSRAIFKTSLNKLIRFDINGLVSDFGLSTIDLELLRMEPLKVISNTMGAVTKGALTEIRQGISGLGSSDQGGGVTSEAVQKVKGLFGQ